MKDFKIIALVLIIVLLHVNIKAMYLTKEDIFKKPTSVKSGQELENLKKDSVALLSTTYDKIKNKDQTYIFEVLSAQIQLLNTHIKALNVQIQVLKNQIKDLQKSQTVRGAVINLPEKNK